MTATPVPLPSEWQGTHPLALNTTLIESQTCAWIPDMTTPWNIEYDSQGLSSMSQQWIVPRTDELPIVIRQLLSWNRHKFSAVGSFKDVAAGDAKYYDFGTSVAGQGIVVTSASLQPMLEASYPGYLDGHMQSPLFAIQRSGPCYESYGSVAACPDARFPSVLAAKYRLTLQWNRDEYVNRFGILYAKVEINPSIRLESISGSSMGVIPMNGTGEPDTAGDIRRLSIGFPLREPQVLIRVTYPWVSLGSKGNPRSYDIVNAGPLGRQDADTYAPGKIPLGQYLGTVNAAPFLGYPKGHVLYQSATLEPKVSPATGRLGFMVTHEFLAIATASWNMTRFEGDPLASLTKDDPDAENVLWPYGYIVAIKKADQTVLQVDGEPVYPYVHKDMSKLMYYGWRDAPNIPADEG